MFRVDETADLSRRGFLTRVGRLGAAAIGLAVGRVVPDKAIAGPLMTRRFSFRDRPNRAGWGSPWIRLHFERRWRVFGGWGELFIPRGRSSTAPDQPMPVFLLDNETADQRQKMLFRVTERSLRPGVLFGASGGFDYHAVTVESRQLVLARYHRTGREVLTTAPCPYLHANRAYFLVVKKRGRAVRAKLWRRGTRAPGWMLRGLLDTVSSGMSGVLVVHPTSLAAGRLQVQTYEVATTERFKKSAPRPTYSITGVPALRDGMFSFIARTGSLFPAYITFEWTTDGSWRSFERSRRIPVRAAPFNTKHVIKVPFAAGRSVLWRARLTSPSTGRSKLTPVQRVRMPQRGGRIAVAAASCAHLWNSTGYEGLSRVMEEASAPLRALAYQGDLGYASNARLSCYTLRPDFFADRFARFLLDPNFISLRRSVPTCFTLDDHDYGPRNNAHGAQIPSWAPRLWNRIHADPSPKGYFDFRVDDVHFVTLDCRRYADSALAPDEPSKTRLGIQQRTWLENLLSDSDASMFVMLSAGIFASRRGTLDCWLFGWPDEYRTLMALFTSVQLAGRRVLIVSGDAHGMRIHHHPDPEGRPEAAARSVVEFICSGLEAGTWSGAVPEDLTLDPTRTRLGLSGLGLIEVDPPGSNRSVLLRAISSSHDEPPDIFPPLALPFDPRVPLAVGDRELPRKPRGLTLTPQE